ncbi:MAG: DUF86 domain-containing protein [Ignavibacteria bacterium CG2_30_36_16]|nr:DUF86 domain-containing protein [Ignavibacteria bacterium]OIP63820.1 MAG: DUF86 domain-containing protein [Ignavibacteria bacterium CG2_30_36_16]PJA99131.1 MAG: DUF86 domain-containing protein [Ignavibacteria bacterium CG_4_9_14_3_um_filter_36_18]
MKQDKVYLQHIYDEISFILNECKNLDFNIFIESEIYTRAFSRSLEIIGEAVKSLSSEFKALHDEIEWKKIAGMRDKLIHEYFSVDYEIMWDVIKNKLPDMKTKIGRFL